LTADSTRQTNVIISTKMPPYKITGIGLVANSHVVTISQYWVGIIFTSK
jgi:hypothetical protein